MPEPRRRAGTRWLLQYRLDLADDTLHVLIAHGREQGQGHSLASDARRHRCIFLAIARLPIKLETGNTRIVHADADAALRHGLLKSHPRHAARGKVDQYLKHVPAMSGIAACRHYRAGEALECVEVAARQIQAAGIEAVQAPQLVNAD